MSEELEFFNPWKQFTGCWLPNWLLEREELDLGPKVCYARLAQFAGRNGVAVIKQDVLARKLATDDRSVSRWLGKLRKAGLVHITRRGPYRPAEYRFLRHQWMLGAVELPDAPDWRIKTRQIVRHDTPDLRVTPNTEKKPKRGPAPKPPRPEIEELCSLLADRIIGNDGSPAVYRPRVSTAAWRDSMRLLLDKDLAVDREGKPVPFPERVEKVRKAINWCQDDEFWRGNILSPGALREKYDQLRHAAKRNSQNGNSYRNGDRRPPPEIPEADLSTRPPRHDPVAMMAWSARQLEEAGRP